MGGAHKLEGEVALKAMYWLKVVTNILEANGIKYFLDAGTLLGVIREGRLLPWDTDIDLFVPETEIQKLNNCVLPLFFRGLKVRRKPVSDFLPPLEVGKIRVLKLKNRNLFLHRGKVSIDIFVKYLVGDKYLWAEGASGSQVLKAVPTLYFNECIYVEFDGKKYPVPREYDAYLTYRYGNWRLPVEDWNHLVDDRSVVF